MSDTTAGTGDAPSVDDGIEIEGLGRTIEGPEVQAEEKPQKVEPPEDDEGDQDSDEEKAEWSRAKRRREHLKSENKRLADEVAALKARYEAPQQQPQPQEQKPSQDGDDPEPKIEDFKDVLDYIRATQKWESRQAVKADNAARNEAEGKAKAEQARQEKIDAYDKRVEPLLEQVPDFYERVSELANQGRITPQIEDAVLDSPMSELVTLHLLTNPGDLQVMQGMDDKQAAVAVARIEAYIQNNMKSSPQTETVASKPTKAAAPITPVGKNASTATKEWSEDMSQQDFEAAVARLSPRRR